jgi:N-acetylglucosamine repressor
VVYIVKENSNLGVTSRHIRLTNQELIFSILRYKKPLSASDLSFMSKLSLSTIKTVLSDLIDMGLVISEGTGNSTGGRKPEIFSLNTHDTIIAGISSGRTWLLCGLYTIDKACIDETLLDLGEHSIAALVTIINETIKKLFKKNKIDPKKLAAVGITQSGIVDENGKMVISSLHQGWQSIPIGDLLQEETGAPVFIMEDARAFLTAENEFSGVNEYNDRLYLLMGPNSSEWGIGSGIVVGGNILKGGKGIAGEVGHILVRNNGRKCCCGRFGCWEAEAEPRIFFKRYIETRKISNDPKTIFEHLIKDGANGDKEVLLEIEEYAQLNASAITNLIHILNPEKVIVGGQISLLGKDFLCLLLKYTKKYCISQFFFDDMIEMSDEQNNKSVLGAVISVINRLVSIKTYSKEL